MTADDLRAEINIEIEAIRDILQELLALHIDIGEREPAVREKTAAATFMAQFYGGIENILKRISKFHGIPIPTGETWHLDLFQRFCSPSYQSLPELFDKFLADELSPFRRFRHVVYHSYGFQLEWIRMKGGIEKVADIFTRFRVKLLEYLDGL